MENLEEYIKEAIETAGGTTITTEENQVIDGTLDVSGNVTLKKNLKVEGFVDAPNIRGCSKGLYRTREELVAKYPHPHIGWWAVVANWTSEEVEVGDTTGDSEGTITESVVTYDSVLYMVKLDEYQQAYWYDTGRAVRLDGLIDQFGDIDSMWEAIHDVEADDKTHDAWLKALTEWVMDAYNELDTNTKALEAEVVKEIGARGDDVLTLETAATPLVKTDDDGIERAAGYKIDIDGRVDLSGVYSSIDNVAEEVNAIEETLSDYPEEKKKWDGVSEQLLSGRVNNGTERFDGMVCSEEVHCDIYHTAPEEGYSGIYWLCDKKMFVAYEAFALTPDDGGDAYLYYKFYTTWDTVCLYMENPATEGGLWKDKLYMAEGHVWMWKRCDANLCLAGAAGDYEVITNEEIDEMMANFTLVGPVVTKFTFNATEPLVAETTRTDEGEVTVNLSITEATEKQIDNIFGKEE